MPVVFHLSGLPDSLAGQTRDIGTSGVCLATPSPFSFRSLTRVTIDLPTGPLGLAAEGRWQRESSDSDGILTGVRFIDPPAEAWSLLWNVVQMRAKVIFSFLQEADQLLLDFDERMELALFTRLRKLDVGKSIYSQNRTDLHSIFLVFSGQVVLETEIQGRRHTLARLHRGDSFGGLNLLTSLPALESAMAATGTHLLEIEPYTYRYLEISRPALARRIRELVFQSYLTRFHDLLERQPSLRGGLSSVDGKEG